MRYRAMLIIAIVMIVFFATAGWALYKAFEESVEQSAQSTMEAYIVSLLSTMDFVDNNAVDDIYNSDPENNDEQSITNDEDHITFDPLPLPQLAQPNSGIYAEIWENDSLLWRSDSLIGKALPRLSSAMSEYQFYPNQQTAIGVVSLLTLGVDWEDDDIVKKFNVIMSVDALPYQQSLRGYAKTLFTWLFLMSVLLLLLQIMFFSFLFRPLSRVVGQLNEIESGERLNFDDKYPNEVLVLTSSLNAYIEHEKTQITKQKASLANLAHALKTPLAVIRAALAEKPIDVTSAEQQLDAISGSIEYQLNKATALSRQRYLKPIKCLPNVNSMVSALRKLYVEKGVEILIEIDNEAVFFGDEGDFLEVIGNLLENACKWCDKRVFLKIENVNSINESHKKRLRCVVLDDGPGIPESKRKLIVQRGKRLDEKVKGHGIGLSIVNDIVESYGGDLQFKDAKGELMLNDRKYVLTSGLEALLLI